jgi:hypothetical protein
VANEARSKGNDVIFAPTVNIMRTPRGGRTFEGYAVAVGSSSRDLPLRGSTCRG